MPRAPGLTACERWFIHRGVPHFIVSYDAATDIWTRSIPALVALYVLRFPYRIETERGLWWNVGWWVLVLGVAAGTWLLTNLHRRQRPFSWPRRIGAVELAVWVITPEIPWMLAGEWRSVLTETAIALVILGLVYVGTSYAVVPLVRWAVRQSLALVDTIGPVLTRALPLLLVSITFLFLASEVWQVMGELHGLAYWASLGLFFLIGLAFVISRAPGDVAAAGTLTSWEQVGELVAGTPASELDLPSTGTPPAASLSRRELVNVGLVGLVTRAVQVLAVVAAVGAFLVLFGVLAVTEPTTAAWVGATPDVLASWTIGDRELVLTVPLLRVAGFLATFAGMSFTVYLVTDPTYRQEFRADIGAEVRDALAVRAAYRWSLGQP